MQRPLGRRRRGALSEALAKRQGRVAEESLGPGCTAGDGGEELGTVRQTKHAGTCWAGDSSWWQAPPLLGGECLPFVSRPVNSLSPCLTPHISSQPSILPLHPAERAVGAAPGGVRGVPAGGWWWWLYQTCSSASTRQRSCLAGDILCPWGPVSNSS